MSKVLEIVFKGLRCNSINQSDQTLLPQPNEALIGALEIYGSPRPELIPWH